MNCGNLVRPFKWPLCDLLGLLGVLLFLYLFLLSISLMGASFSLFGKDVAEQVLVFTSSPLVGLFVGVLATSLVQSSSTTTSLVVGMVAGGVLTVEAAIPIIMGANIGTSVTNTLVSVAHIQDRKAFRRAFAASTVHDFFNLLSVALLFPLQYFTNFLGIVSQWLAEAFNGLGGLIFVSPVKAITAPVSQSVIDSVDASAPLVLMLGIFLLFVSLKYLVTSLRFLVISRVETLFDNYIFQNASHAFISGIVLTVLVQSSSITTSLVVPLAGAGVLALKRIYPYTLGTNIGTTVTALLASMVSGAVAPVTVAFSHLVFNLAGIVVITSVSFLRYLPMQLAKAIAGFSAQRRWFPIIYIGLVFFLLPLIVILSIG
jgi:sodium-dependent phosphate cotransporter